jgi:hypothetical protein
MINGHLGQLANSWVQGVDKSDWSQHLIDMPLRHNAATRYIFRYMHVKPSSA